MICDEQGFCGGMNIQEEVGEELYGTSRFYDVHAKPLGGHETACEPAFSGENHVNTM